VLIALLFSLVAAGAVSGDALDVARPHKEALELTDPAIRGRTGGENIATATVIPALPYSDIGSTCGYQNDYDEICPYPASVAPDVVYSYEPPVDVCLSINLCNSLYDTKVYVYEDDWSPGEPIACNDDNSDCVDPPVEFTSWIENVAVYAGHTYYIVVDGYGAGCGEYVLEVEAVDCPPPCVLECQPGSGDEGEGPCYDGYVDNVNGGCGSIPVAFYEPEPGENMITICGLSGNFDNNTMRDTDWYLLELTCEETPVTICVEAEFEVVLGFVDMREGCAGLTGFYSYVYGDPCELVCLTESLPPGDWVVYVAVDGWLDIPCGSDYVLTIDGYDSCTGVAEMSDEMSWSTIKALYR
jgi:hypothetical protein